MEKYPISDFLALLFFVIVLVLSFLFGLRVVQIRVLVHIVTLGSMRA